MPLQGCHAPATGPCFNNEPQYTTMNQPQTPLTPVDVSVPPPVPPAALARTGRDAGGGWFAAVLPVILIAACAELGISVLNNSALPVYFRRGLHLPTRIYGVVMAMFFLSEVLFKSPLGALADRFGRRPLMLGGAAVTVFTPILLLSMHYNPFSATAVAALIGFGFLRAMDGLGEAALWPSLYAYVGDVVVEAKRGAAMGVLNLVYMVGIAFSFLAGGYVDDTFGPVLTHSRRWRTRCTRPCGTPDATSAAPCTACTGRTSSRRTRRSPPRRRWGGHRWESRPSISRSIISRRST